MGTKNIIGTIPIDLGLSGPTSVSAPVISAFTLRQNADDLNQIVLLFAVSDFTSIKVSTTLIDDDYNPIGASTDTDVTNQTQFQIVKDANYRTKITLQATNSVGTTSKDDVIDKAPRQVVVLDDVSISSFDAQVPSNSFNTVNLYIAISPKAYDANPKIDLLYRREDYTSFQSVRLVENNTSFTAYRENGIVKEYRLSLSSVNFLRYTIGGFFLFYVKMSFGAGYAPVSSETKRLYYDDISPSQASPENSARFPKAEIIDRFASLRYEVDAKFYQVYGLQSNVVYIGRQDQTPQLPTFFFRFLSNSDVAGLEVSDYLIPDWNGGYSFYYEYNNSKSDGSTKGYMYPASVSEIYPCILPQGTSGNNQSVIFFWKINENFFDYNYSKQQISIVTRTFKIKLQYKQGSSYVDLTNTISINKDSHYQTSTDKFILELKRDVDILESRRALFNAIIENDNLNDNVRFLVVEHSVICFYPFAGVREYVFDKLLMPPNWKYIAYDKYVPRDAASRKSDKIEIQLSSQSLRGIRVPETGFKVFDRIVGIQQRTHDSQGTYDATFDISLFYKISCSFTGFYKDPILEGTVNSIVIPKLPDDVFLIPPLVSIPEPNLVSKTNGGIQAEGRAILDDYGKVRAVEITNPGAGYSLYKNSTDKRKQTFTDFVPTVVTSYKVNSVPIAYTKDQLVPKNTTFDSSYLVASMQQGVRLNSVLEDARAMDANLSEDQKQQISEYVDYAPPLPNVPADDSSDSSSIYDEIAPQIEDFQNITDLEWYEVSKLFTDKYNNPLDTTTIYNEEEDPATVGQDDSSVSSSPSSSPAETTPTSAVAGSSQSSQNGSDWTLFSLPNLPVIPDGSAATSVSNFRVSAPWLTLLPLSVRRDGERGYGPLPNMKTRAEMFNRIVSAINNLNEVRVIVPYIWLVTTTNKFEEWVTPVDAFSFDEISFSTAGTKVANYNTISDSVQAINQGFAVAASRSVGKTEIHGREAQAMGLSSGGIYAVSIQDSSSQRFVPKIHPFMAGAIPAYIGNSVKKRILGFVTKTAVNCSSAQTPVSSTLGTTVFVCGTRAGNYFEKPYPRASFPYDSYVTESYFQFFDSGGSISVSPRGTARYAGTQIEKYNEYAQFCYASCGDSDMESIDFSYANMFPATFKLA